MSKELLEPILEGGVRGTAFFNGRLLTAEDLQAEQEAQRQQHRQLGRAIGSGVARGLEVRAATTGALRASVRVSKGLALSPQGQTLTLPDDTEVVLTRQVVAPEAATGGRFVECDPGRLTAVPTGTGFYLLLLGPAAGFEGRAPMSGLGAEGGITGCGDRYLTEGVRFRLVRLDPLAAPGLGDEERARLVDLMNRSDQASVSLLRNLLAHLCFGTEELERGEWNPFARDGEAGFLPGRYGLLDALAATDPSLDCDVPLALLYWTADGIRFVDMWAVRRVPAPAPLAPLPPLLSARRAREAEAVLLQFQEQLEWVLADAARPEAVVAQDSFRYVPAAGILPLASSEQPRGFDYRTFFRGQVWREPVFVEGARTTDLLRAGLDYPPIDLLGERARGGEVGAMPGGHELLRLYLVHDRRGPAPAPEVAGAAAYLVYTTGHLPFQGYARFNLSRFDYSNYTYRWDFGANA